MKKVVQVRNITIGEGMPKICVSIIETTKEDILAEAKIIKDLPVDVVEWRVDWFRDYSSLDRVVEVAKELRMELIDKPLLFTFRTKDEGGEKEISASDYVLLNEEILKINTVDLIDVELSLGDTLVQGLIKSAHNNKVKVIASNHDFNKTPPKEEIIKRLCKMQELGADISKIAVMPNSRKDVLELLMATDEMDLQYGTGPIVTMSMDSSGMISRLSGEIFGSSLTFAALRKASAPGQIAVIDLHSVLHIIHKNINK